MLSRVIVRFGVKIDVLLPMMMMYLRQAKGIAVKTKLHTKS